MTLLLIAGPATEPVTLDEARAYLRLDTDDEDVLLQGLLTAARATLEAETRRAFVTQSWRLLFDKWPGKIVTIPLAPVVAFTSVKIYAADGTATTVSASDYDIDVAHEPPRIASKTGWPRPGRRVAGIGVDFTAGYGDADAVPAPLKQAILMLAAHWFEARLPVSVDGRAMEIPLTIAALIAPYRRLSL